MYLTAVLGCAQVPSVYENLTNTVSLHRMYGLVSMLKISLAAISVAHKIPGRDENIETRAFGKNFCSKVPAPVEDIRLI